MAEHGRALGKQISKGAEVTKREVAEFGSAAGDVISDQFQVAGKQITKGVSAAGTAMKTEWTEWTGKIKFKRGTKDSVEQEEQDENHHVKQIHANLRNASYYVGEARLEGKPVKIAIADLNSNGRYDDVEMSTFEGDRFFIDRNGDGHFESPSIQRGYPYGGVTRIGERWLSIVARPDGGRLRIRAVSPELGTVRVSPLAAQIDLRSEKQPGVLVLANGSAMAVAGVYVAREIVLGVTDAKERRWETRGTFPADAPVRVVVRAGATTTIAAGPPLRVEPRLTRQGDPGALEISLGLRGAGGETYRWAPFDDSLPKPGFEIRDEAGVIVHQATFDYG